MAYTPTPIEARCTREKRCGAQMRIIAFIEDEKVIDKIIKHLKLSFIAERPPPPLVLQQELLMAAEEREEYF